MSATFEAEDLELKKKKIQEAEELKKDYQNKIKRAKKDIEAMQIMKQMLPSALEDKKREEEELLSQIRDLEAQKQALQNNGELEGMKQNDELQKNLSNLENVLADNVEKLEMHQNLQDSLEFKLDKAKQSDSEITDKINKYESLETKFDKYQMRIPKIAPIALYLNDLEDRLQLHKQSIVDSKNLIQAHESSIEHYEEKNSVSQSKLSRKQAKLDDITDKTRINEFQRERLKTEYMNLTSELSRLQTETDKVKSQFQAQLNNYKTEDELIYSEINLFKDKLNELDKKIKNFPEDSKIEINNNKVMVNKKKQLAQQIQKKINDSLYEISNRQNQSPEVMQLSKSLEKHWKEHQILEDSTNKQEIHLHNLQDLLERKKESIEEVSHMIHFLESQGKKISTGLKGLDLLYETALTENRKFDAYNRKLTRELEIYEAEHRQFTRELDELNSKNS